MEEVDRLLGLDAGADDYICNPSSSCEVVARIKAILRRSPQLVITEPTRLLIDEDRYQASLDGVALDMPPFLSCACLASWPSAQSPGLFFSRHQLLDRIYFYHRVVTDRTVDSHLRNLPRKLGQACPEEPPSESLYGLGYRVHLADS